MTRLPTCCEYHGIDCSLTQGRSCPARQPDPKREPRALTPDQITGMDDMLHFAEPHPRGEIHEAN